MTKRRSEAAQAAWDAWKSARKELKRSRLAYTRGHPREVIHRAVDAEQAAKRLYETIVEKERIASLAPKHNAMALSWLVGIAKRDPRYAGLIVSGRRIIATDGKILVSLDLRDGAERPLPGADGWRSLKAPYNIPNEDPGSWTTVVKLFDLERSRARRSGDTAIGFDPSYVGELAKFKAIGGFPITWVLHPSEDENRTTLWVADFGIGESPTFSQGAALICPRRLP